MRVRERFERPFAVRGTAMSAFEAGPSTSTCIVSVLAGVSGALTLEIWLYDWKLLDLVQTYALVIDYLNDDGESASVWAMAEENDTANFYQSPLACCYVCVTHFTGCRWILECSLDV